VVLLLVRSPEVLLGGGSEEEQGNAVVVSLSTWLFVICVVKIACESVEMRGGDELRLFSGLKNSKSTEMRPERTP
jgi:hypothetical protein